MVKDAQRLETIKITFPVWVYSYCKYDRNIALINKITGRSARRLDSCVSIHLSETIIFKLLT